MMKYWTPLFVVPLLQLLPWTLAQFELSYRPTSNTYVHVSPPDGIQSLKGLRQKLRCDSSYMGEPVEIVWYKNDQMILNTNPSRLTINEYNNRLDTASVSILTILITRVIDSGRYSCRMKPPGRSVTTVVVAIYEKPIVVGSPSRLLVPDQNMTLTCKMIPDLTDQGAKYFWHKEGRFIGTRGFVDVDSNGSPDVDITPNGTLTIINPLPAHGGTYTCRVRYMVYGKTSYVSSDIKVFVNITVRTEPYNWYNVNTRRPIQLRCIVQGFPYAEVYWSHHEIRISTTDARNNVTVMTRPLDHVNMLSTLFIRELPGNFNVTHYECTGTNNFGSEQKVAAIVNTEHVFRPFGIGASSLVAQSTVLYCLAIVLWGLIIV